MPASELRDSSLERESRESSLVRESVSFGAGEAGVNGDVGVGCFAFAGVRGGMGRIQIRSRSRLCCLLSGVHVQGASLTRSRSSSIRRKMSVREKVSSWPLFFGDLSNLPRSAPSSVSPTTMSASPASSTPHRSPQHRGLSSFANSAESAVSPASPRRVRAARPTCLADLRFSTPSRLSGTTFSTIWTRLLVVKSRYGASGGPMGMLASHNESRKYRMLIRVLSEPCESARPFPVDAVLPP